MAGSREHDEANTACRRHCRCHRCGVRGGGKREVAPQGARANGYATDLWTLDRVGAVIESVTGVAYHRGHVLARTLPSGLKVSEPTGTMPPLMKGWPRR